MEPVVMNEKSALVGIRRGLGCRCPNCGEGRLFRSYLKIEPVCKVCGNDNAVYPSDDLPPYLTILVVGHLLIPAFMWVSESFSFGLIALLGLRRERIIASNEALPVAA
jgi:uncharacterized protein (DUF983 family)